MIKHYPYYLHNNLKIRHDIYNSDLRHKYMIFIPKHESFFFQKILSHNIAHLCNKLPHNIKLLYGLKFKANARNIIYRLH